MVLLFTISIPGTVMGQESNDHDDLLRTTLMVAEMIPSYHTDSSGKQQLAILDNDQISPGINLNWFDVPVLIISGDEISAKGFKCWIEFSKLNISGEAAEVNMLYRIEGSETLQFSLKLKKYDSLWCITENISSVL